MIRRCGAVVATGLILIAAPAPARAQDVRGIVTLAAGAANYDLSGVGWAPVVAARVGLAFGPWLVLEPAIAWLRYEAQDDEDITLLFPEVQLQLEVLHGSARPYLGAGAGWARADGPGTSSSDLTLSLSAGIRTRLNDTVGFVGEMRIRSIDPFAGTTADLTAGLTFAF